MAYLKFSGGINQRPGGDPIKSNVSISVLVFVDFCVYTTVIDSLKLAGTNQKILLLCLAAAINQFTQCENQRQKMKGQAALMKIINNICTRNQVFLNPTL